MLGFFILAEGKQWWFVFWTRISYSSHECQIEWKAYVKKCNLKKVRLVLSMWASRSRVGFCPGRALAPSPWPSRLIAKWLCRIC